MSSRIFIEEDDHQDEVPGCFDGTLEDVGRVVDHHVHSAVHRHRTLGELLELMERERDVELERVGARLDQIGQLCNRAGRGDDLVPALQGRQDELPSEAGGAARDEPYLLRLVRSGAHVGEANRACAKVVKDLVVLCPPRVGPVYVGSPPEGQRRRSDGWLPRH